MIEEVKNETSLLIMRKLLTSLGWLVLVALIFTSGFIAGNVWNGQSILNNYIPSSRAPIGLSTQENDLTEEDFDVFWEAWNTIEERYYYDLPEEDVRVYGAVNGLVQSLDDQHSGFVNPEGADFMRERLDGSFEGIGAVVETAPNGGVFIIRVFDDSPAEKAGIRAGDIVIQADDIDLFSKTLDEAIEFIRGPAGTTVDLLIFREGEDRPLEIPVVRGRIEFPTVEYEMLENDIGYVALFDFYSFATARTREAIRDLLDQGATALIFDLRGNGGGYLNQAVDVADLFLPDGVVLIQRDVDGNTNEFNSRNGDVGEDIPIVVLIDETSASASEIVAGAIQDRDRGVLIGEQSFGKGSVQTLYDLSDGSLLRLTTANWYTPADRSITEEGIMPDIEVEMSFEDIATGDGREADIQLQAAIQYLTDGQQ